MSAHFLRYSVLPVNLSPKLSELHLVDAISGHFPPYVQRALLSAGVRTVQDALTFLRKMETIENFDERGKKILMSRTKLGTRKAVQMKMVKADLTGTETVATK
jgi:hypothetical protein